MGVCFGDVQAARQRIREFIYCSPAPHSAAFSEMTGQQVFLKLDNLQRTGAFKERGALNRILTLNDEEKRHGVIAASAGNHAQAVAYHATQRGIRSDRDASDDASGENFGDAGFGAEVILHGANYDEACEEALRRAHQTGAVFLHPFDDVDVINGQGTIGLELMEQVPGWRRSLCRLAAAA